MNRDKINTMEDFLRKQNLKLMIENIELRERLECEEIIYSEEVEEGYKEYYDESNEVLK